MTKYKCMYTINKVINSEGVLTYTLVLRVHTKGRGLGLLISVHTHCIAENF